MLKRKSVQKNRRALQETIRAIIAEGKVDSLLEAVRLDENDFYALQEGSWEGLKKKLAAAGLSIACTATGCAPVTADSGTPVDPSKYGISVDELPPGQSAMDFDGTTSGVAGMPDIDKEPPPNKIGRSAVNKPAMFPKGSPWTSKGVR